MLQIIDAEALKTITAKELVKLFLPPIAIQSIKRYRNRWKAKRTGFDKISTSTPSGLTGDYSTWAAAEANSGGYGAEIILRKTADAIRKVKRGDAVYERDSVLFDEVQYAWPALAGLMWVAAQNGGQLNVLDIGGSLGSAYFQNRALLDRLENVRWNIVEQPGQVEVGRREFQDDRLQFYESVEACLADSEPNVILLSSVLQYLEDPYELLDTLVAISCRWLIIDRTPFWEGSADRLCVQHVPHEIYDASYPSWIFSVTRFRSILSLNWNETASFRNIDSLSAPVPVTYRGLIATKRYT
jgi:putative methyltransferase (TIGR04325 family)